MKPSSNQFLDTMRLLNFGQNMDFISLIVYIRTIISVAKGIASNSLGVALPLDARRLTKIKIFREIGTSILSILCSSTQAESMLINWTSVTSTSDIYRLEYTLNFEIWPAFCDEQIPKQFYLTFILRYLIGFFLILLFIEPQNIIRMSEG